MSDFLDLQELENAVDMRLFGNRKHPLRTVISEAEKLGYAGGLLFGALSNDGALRKNKAGKVSVISATLGMSQNTIEEVKTVVMGLQAKHDRLDYLDEVISALKDRRIFLHFVFDLIAVMDADGDMTKRGEKFLSVLFNRCSVLDDDVDFIKERMPLAKSNGKNAIRESVLTRQDAVCKSVDRWFEFKIERSEDV